MGDNNLPSSDDDDEQSDSDELYDTLADKESRQSRKLERTRESYKKAEIPEKDRAVMSAFDKALTKAQLENNRYCDARIATHLRQARLTAEDVPGILDRLVNGAEEEIDEAISDVKENCKEVRDLADSTIGSYVQTLVCIGEFFFDETPEPFDELDPRSWYDEDPTPAATNILYWSDAVAMAETCDHIRNRAMILTEYGGGFRPESELWELKFRHLEDCGSHIKITVPEDAKTGGRTIKLFPGSAILRKWWKEEHPARQEGETAGPETYLWTHHNQNKPITYDQIKRIFRQAGEDAEISKTHTAQHFRRSRASTLAARKEINHMDLHNFFGWARESETPIHYIAASSTNTNKHVAAADGAMVELTEPEPVAPIPCPECEEWTERKVTHCIHCAQEIDEADVDDDLIAVDQDKDSDLIALILDGEISARDLVGAQRLEMVIKTRRRFWDELDQLIELARRNESGSAAVSEIATTAMFITLLLLAVSAFGSLF